MVKRVNLNALDNTFNRLMFQARILAFSVLSNQYDVDILMSATNRRNWCAMEYIRI